MRRFARDNGLGLFFGGIFLITLVGQALVGHADFNHQQLPTRTTRSRSAATSSRRASAAT